ncbi:hypothetical protein [Limosilactobacillus vaginalis]|uniref:hypothetical protein n=1 Tax=Limosilactobacillus vaginalis TaxID=1633 RepID=UPI0025A3352E|nr:hypothetical protein [Limosilactobacillus vaginalis]
MEIPHKDDLATNSKLPGMLTENFKSIEQEESQLRNDLNDETDARINGDGKLQSQIDAIIQRLDTNEKSIADLQTRMKTAEDHIKKLDDIIFGMEYIDDTDEFMLDNSTPNPSEVEINDDVAVDDDNAEVVKELPHEVISNEVS